jgi:hypothetical protein
VLKQVRRGQSAQSIHAGQPLTLGSADTEIRWPRSRPPDLHTYLTHGPSRGRRRSSGLPLPAIIDCALISPFGRVARALSTLLQFAEANSVRGRVVGLICQRARTPEPLAAQRQPETWDGGRRVVTYSYSLGVRDGIPSEFERLLAELHRPLPRRWAEPSLDASRDGDVTLPAARSMQARANIHLVNGSGKSMMAGYLLMQAKRSTGGFTASARQLARAGVGTEALSLFVRRPRSADALPDQGSGHPSAVTDGQHRVASLATSSLPHDRESRSRLTVRLQARIMSAARWSTDLVRQAELEIGEKSAELAARFRSLCGPSSGPPPDEPPCQLVRARSRVPRGPNSFLSDPASISFGGVPSTA